MSWSPLDVLQDVFDEVPDIVIAFTEDGRYLYVNKRAAEFLSTRPIDVIGRHWKDMGYPAEVMLPFAKRVERIAATGEAEHYRSTSSAERGSRVFDMSLTPIWSEEGHVLAVLAIAHDISEFFEVPRSSEAPL